jgi:hypothetical protein
VFVQDAEGEGEGRARLELNAGTCAFIVCVPSPRGPGAACGFRGRGQSAGYPASVGEPPRQLRGYQKVFLNPGESRQVSVTLAPQAFAYWDTSRNAWTVAAGTYRVFAGGSSRSLPLQGSVAVAGQLLGS